MDSPGAASSVVPPGGPSEQSVVHESEHQNRIWDRLCQWRRSPGRLEYAMFVQLILRASSPHQKMAETETYSLALLEIGNLTPALLVADRCVKAAGVRLMGIES